MATSKARTRRPNHRGVEDARDVTPPPRVAKPEPAPPAMIELTPSPDAGEAITIRQEAAMITVEDKASHTQALEFVRGAKQLKRKIEDHWSRITRNVDDLKRNLLDLKRRDLEPLEVAIGLLNDRIVTYVEGEQRRAREEADRDRAAREEQARKDREKELADQEAEALRLEAQSPTLSDRETQFAMTWIALGPQGTPTLAQATGIARRLGYKNPEDTAQKLLATPKILDFVASQRAAAALREQAEQVRRQPVIAAPAARVESKLGKVAGTRMVTTYSAEVYDLDELIAAVSMNRSLQKGKNGPLAANTVFLNQEAEKYRESLESVYPGVRIVKRTTVAG